MTWEREAEKIYYAIFKKQIPAFIKNHFENISKTIDNNYSEKDVRKYHQYLVKVYDIESLELAARYFKRLPILTEKFKVMVYLAETLPENQSIFVNEDSKRFFAHVFLISSLLRTFYKFLKGIFLFTVYG